MSALTLKQDATKLIDALVDSETQLLATLRYATTDEFLMEQAKRQGRIEGLVIAGGMLSEAFKQQNAMT